MCACPYVRAYGTQGHTGTVSQNTSTVPVVPSPGPPSPWARYGKKNRMIGPLRPMSNDRGASSSGPALATVAIFKSHPHWARHGLTSNGSRERDEPEVDTIEGVLESELGAKTVEEIHLTAPEDRDRGLKVAHARADGSHYRIGEQARMEDASLSIDDTDNDPYSGLAGPNDPAGFSR